MRISVDVGGTFTDVIVLDEETSRLRLEKVETTPRNPASGVLAGFRKPESTEGRRRVSVLKWRKGAPLNLG